MRTMIVIALALAMTGCAGRRPPPEPLIDVAKYDADQEQKALVEKYEGIRTNAEKERDDALAKLGEVKFPQSTIMLRQAANQCLAAPESRTNDKKFNECQSKVFWAEHAEGHEIREHEYKKQQILAKFDSTMYGANLHSILDVGMLKIKMIQAEERRAPVVVSAPPVVAGNSYNTPAMVIQPRPGMSYTDSGVGSWTLSGRGTYCSGISAGSGSSFRCY